MAKQKTIKIGNKLVGDGQPVFIIAEAGVNHNGKLNLALQLTKEAKKAGADAVKFQTFKAENVVSAKAQMADYQKKNIGKNISQQEAIKQLELGFANFQKIKQLCDKIGIIFLSTPHSDEAIDFLAPLVPAFKIGSGDLTNLPFLEKISQKKKPIILGTGMANLQEIKEAVKTMQKTGNDKIVLLQCTTNYPCPLEEANLNAIKTLQKTFSLPIGYSDHTLGITSSIMATAMGACLIEKHFTLDKKMPGPDHRASADPEEFANMVKEIRNAEKALGNGKKQPTQSEKKISHLVRKSLIAQKDIQKNEVLSNDKIIIKRPMGGIEPKDLKKALGKRAKKLIKQDEFIKFKDLI